MTVIEPYTAECSECGYSEMRMGLMSFNTMVGIPEGLIVEHPVGCPKCGDVGFDVYDDDEDDDDDDEECQCLCNPTSLQKLRPDE